LGEMGLPISSDPVESLFGAAKTLGTSKMKDAYHRISPCWGWPYLSTLMKKTAHPVDNAASSPGYRREMVRVLAKKAIREALIPFSKV